MKGRYSKSLTDIHHEQCISSDLVRCFLFSHWCKWIFCWTTLLYLNSLWNDFVFDDREAILSNSDVVHGMPLRNLFTNDFWGIPMSHPESHKSYRPLTILSFRIQHDMHGLSAFALHLVNTLLHSILTLVFTYLSFLLTDSESVGLVAGLLFGVHPIHTEAVAGVVGRAEILSGLFYLAAYLAYLRSNRLESNSAIVAWLYLLLALLLVFLSMLSKEQGITILGVFLFSELSSALIPKHRNVRPSLSLVSWSSILCIALSGVVFVYWRVFHIGGGTQPKFKDSDNPAAFANSSSTRSLTYSYLGALNLWLLLCPYWLCSDWSMGSVPLVHSLSDTRLLPTSVAVLLLSALAVRAAVQLSSNKPLITSLLLLLLPYIPASNLFFPVGFVIAERVLYLPSMGFHLLVSIGFNRLVSYFSNKNLKLLLHIPLFLLVMLHSTQTVRRNSEWYSDETMALSGIKINPNNAKLFLSVGNDLAQKGLTKCEEYYRKAIELRENYEAAWSNLGFVLFNMDRSQEAEQCYRKAVGIKWDHVDANTNYAHFLRIKERWREAADKYQIVLNRRPTHAHIRYYQAIVQQQLGNFSGAERELRLSLQLQPSHIPTLTLLGEILVNYTSSGDPVKQFKRVKTPRLREGTEFIRRAVELEPAQGELYCGMLFELLRTLGGVGGRNVLPAVCNARFKSNL